MLGVLAQDLVSTLDRLLVRLSFVKLKHLFEEGHLLGWQDLPIGRGQTSSRKGHQNPRSRAREVNGLDDKVWKEAGSIALMKKTKKALQCECCLRGCLRNYKIVHPDTIILPQNC